MDGHKKVLMEGMWMDEQMVDKRDKRQMDDKQKFRRQDEQTGIWKDG